jgi:hypothetical protein
MQNATRLTSRGTGEKLYFGDNDQWSLRYEDGAFITQDETDGEDIISIDDAEDAIEFARSLGTSEDPIPGTTHFEAVEADHAAIDDGNIRTSRIGQGDGYLNEAASPFRTVAEGDAETKKNDSPVAFALSDDHIIIVY